MRLVIVESPNKIRKIRQFLGPEFRLAASFGHVRDLPVKGGLAVEFRDGAVRPHYELLERAGERLADLKQQAEQADEILLATDPDREGEAIAWHLAQVLGPERKYQRIAFNAVTQAAVRAALAAPRPLDQRLVDAQQARRVLDRVVGWLVSPVLSRGTGLKEARSAGRVQSVAVRLVAEREREIQAFKPVDYFTLDATVAHPSRPPPFTAVLSEWRGEPLGHRLASADTAAKAVEWCRRQEWRVHQVERKQQERQPPPPFITSTVQQAASVRLKLTPDRTMKLLQELFEAGAITYHRTDSVAISPEAMVAVRDYISTHYPPEYLPARVVEHRSKAANTQEAHEAIRPTHVEAGPKGCEPGDRDREALYELIWNRFVASQMAAGRDHHTRIEVAVAPGACPHPQRGPVAMGVFTAKGKVVLFDGWRRVTDDATEETQRRGPGGRGDDDDDESGLLPDVQPGEPLRLDDLVATSRSTKAPPRYTQASLIRKLEHEGIGRPSTYAAIMTVILDRGYVAEKARKLHGTDLGLALTDFLVKKFAGNFIDLSFTRSMEERLDAIARGDEEWERMVTQTAFAVRDLAMAAGLERDPLTETAPRPPAPPAVVDPALGPCPVCGKGMVRREGKFGPFNACSDRTCGATCNPDGKPSKRTQLLIEERARRAAKPADRPAARPDDAPPVTDKPRRGRPRRTAARPQDTGSPPAADRAPAGNPQSRPDAADRAPAGNRPPRPDGAPPRKRGRPPKAAAPPVPAGPPKCPECGGEMARTRDNRGHSFWTCARFPLCRGSVGGSMD